MKKLPVDPNDRAAITAALGDADPNNPICQAVAERVLAVAETLSKQVSELEELPDRIDLRTGTTAFDSIVATLVCETLREDPRFPEIMVHYDN